MKELTLLQDTPHSRSFPHPSAHTMAEQSAAADTNHLRRVVELQQEYFADDLDPPPDAAAWSNEELETFFATGGQGKQRTPLNAQCRALRAALRHAADAWPDADVAWPESLDPIGGQWSAESCGVAVRACEDQPQKGLGVFAVRRLVAGSVVGIYWGEALTPDAFRRRHNRYQGCLGAAVRRCCPRCHDPERHARLSSLGPGRAPMGGSMNGGSYVVCVAHEQHVEWAAREEPERPMYIDAEDPTRSSWARYINHADSGDSTSCNCVLRVAAEPEARAWLVAKRDIPPGDELMFDYGPRYCMQRSDYYASREFECCGRVCIVGVQRE